MRAGNPAQQVEDGQADRREHPVQHAEEQHRGSGGQRKDQLTAPEPADPAKLADVDQAQGGIHDDRPERSGQEGREDTASDQQRDQDRTQGDQRVELALAAECVADGGPAGAAADRKPMQCSGGQVRCPEGKQLLVGVDAIAVPGGERAGREDIVGVRDDRDSDRG